MFSKRRILTVVCLLPAIVVFNGCFGRGPLELTLTVSRGRPSRSLYGGVGQQLYDTLTTPSYGNNSYMAPPTLTGSSVAFLDASCVGPSPSTCTQVFRFRAVAVGQTTVTFHMADGSDPESDVTDTVIVH